MDISIITVSYNAARTIEESILSVVAQEHVSIEHIIIDGGSTDGTRVAIEKHRNSLAHVVVEPDNGVYDAMNKGIRLASGDIIGILNADDVYYNNTCLQKVIDAFTEFDTDAVFGDLVYVKPNNPNKIVRYYRSDMFSVEKFARGCMPAHPTFFVRRECYDKYGLFSTDYRIAADFELLVRFLFKNKISYHYIPDILVKMRTGGISTRNLKSNLILNKEIVRACRANGLDTNIAKVLSKYLTKSFQLIRRPV